MKKEEISIAVENHIKSLRYQAESLLDSGVLFFNEDEDTINKLKDEGRHLFGCIDRREIPDRISTKFLQSTYGKTIFRQYYKSEVGFNVVTKEFAVSLYNKLLKDKKCLEIMSGTGALAKALKDCGADIIATDDYSGVRQYSLSENRWTDVEEIDCLEAIKKYGKDIDCLLVSWIPTNSDIGERFIKLIHEINLGCTVIVIGEESNGISATSTEGFKRLINIKECYRNVIDESIQSREEFIHINFMNNILMHSGDATVQYKTWGMIYDAVYVVEYNKEGEDKNGK